MAEEKIKRLASLVESADDSMMYMLLVSLISSDSIMCLEDCESAMEVCRDLKEAIKIADIGEKKRTIYLGYIDKNIDIINQDIKYYTNEKPKNNEQ